jgi:hypothetical protein
MILIANIGNRNLHIDGKVHAQDAHSPTPVWPQQSGDFKADTRFLLEADGNTLKAAYADRLGMNILNDLMEKLKETSALPDKIYLVGTDQRNIEAAGQKLDTLYAAHVVRALLLKDYPETAVEVVISIASIDDQSQWLRWYRSLIGRLSKLHSGTKMLFCDSGGASQLKQAMKIMAEFMLPADGYTVYYVNQQKGNQEKVQPVPMDEYRTVITQSLVLNLITKGDYSGALNLFNLPESERNTPRKNYLKCLRLAELRMLGDTAESAKIAGNMKPALRQEFPVLQGMAEKRSAETLPDEAFLDDNDWRRFVELFYKAAFLLKNSEWNQAVLAIQICIEHWFESILEFNWMQPNQLTLRKRTLQRAEVMEKLEYILLNHFPAYGEVLKQLASTAGDDSTEHYRLAHRGLPFSIAAASLVPNPVVKLVTSHMAAVLSNNHLSDPKIVAEGMHYLNDIRNRMAHGGLQLTVLNGEQANLGYLPVFMHRLHELLGFGANNPYDQLNTAIEQLILEDR